MSADRKPREMVFRFRALRIIRRKRFGKFQPFFLYLRLENIFSFSNRGATATDNVCQWIAGRLIIFVMRLIGTRQETEPMWYIPRKKIKTFTRQLLCTRPIQYSPQSGTRYRVVYYVCRLSLSLMLLYLSLSFLSLLYHVIY